MSGLVEFIQQAGLPLLFTALSFLVVYQQVKAFSFWKSRGIKGPTPWPFVGTNIYYIFKSKVQVEEEWYQRYGKTYGVYEGLSPVLRTIDNEVIKHVWVKDFSNFTDRYGKIIYGKHIKRWLFWTRGEVWAKQRAIMTPLFTSSRMKSMFNVMVGCINRFLKEIDSRVEPQDSIKNRTKDDPQAIENPKATLTRDGLMSLALDVLASSIFGLKLNTYREKTSEFYKRAFAFARFELAWFLIWFWIPGPIAKFFEIDLIRYHNYEYFDKLSQKTIDERRKTKAGSQKNDFIHTLLEADIPATKSLFNEEDDSLSHFNNSEQEQQLSEHMNHALKDVQLRKFDDLEIRAQMTFLFLAGFETTSNTLAFCFFELFNQPDAQEEVYEELRGLRESKADDQELDYNDIMSAKKLDAFVSEVMRLYSIVTEQNRIVTAPEGVTLPTNPPIRLPCGVGIAASAFSLQRDPEYWPEPNKFDMSRFYPENKGNIVSCTYMPFGLGPRNCAGMRFALLNIKTVLAKTLLKYRVVASPESEQYPIEKFPQHAIFLQLHKTSFNLTPRN